MIKKINLPNYLNPYKNDNLIRLGKDYDGGYLVDKKSVLSTDVLIAIGISYDWSFERDFFKFNKCKISAYDGSVGKKFFFAKIKTRIKNIFKKRSLGYFRKTIWWTLLPIRFFIFFNNFNLPKKKKHFESFVYENKPKLDSEYFVKKNGYNPNFIESVFGNGPYQLNNYLFNLKLRLDVPEEKLNSLFLPHSSALDILVFFGILGIIFFIAWNIYFMTLSTNNSGINLLLLFLLLNIVKSDSILYLNSVVLLAFTYIVIEKNRKI